MIAPDMLLTAAHCTESFYEVQVGRHNRSDDTEAYQSLIVEQIVNHPSYFRNKVLDPDPHDFAVVKLYGRAFSESQNDFIQINRNPSLPTPNQQLFVFGWGATNLEDFREQSDVLRETDAYYIPNDECRQVVGTYRDTTIDYQEVVIDATLCAMNFENLTDSCRGDSGGGLVIRGETPEDDVLVGLVSAGYGCAHPTLPALYARVSEVHEWIREHVCALSEYPPAYLECVDATDVDEQQQEQQPDLGLIFPCQDLPIGRDSEGSVSTPSPSSSSSNIVGIPCGLDEPFLTAIFELRLDTRPEERGWLIRMKNSQGAWATEMERPIFSYAGSDPMSTIRETMFLRKNQEYELVLLDSYGDGHNSMGVAVTSNIVRLFDQDSYDDLLTVTDFSTMNSNGYYLSTNFVVGVLPTEPPTTSPSPTITMSPSASPSEVLPYISVNITFGATPENIGFRLERIIETNGVEIPKVDPASDEHLEVLRVVYPGSFSPELRNSNLTVEIPLNGSTGTEPQTYVFTMTSNEGQGLETGGYSVWMGSIEEGNFLFEGGIFYFEESTSFQVDPDVLDSIVDNPGDVDQLKSESPRLVTRSRLTLGCIAALAITMMQIA